MDWLRRNWPDLLIGVALVAVIAGIIATLISGGTFFPVGGGSRTAETPSKTGPSVAGSNPGSNQVAGQPGSQGTPVVPDAPDGAVNPPAVAQDPAGAPAVTLVDPPAGQASDPVTPAGGGQGQAGAIAVLPPDGQPSASSLTTTAPPAAAATPQSSSAQSSAGAATTVAAATTVTASSSPEAPYRVSVGAYGNIDNAQRQLEAFRAAGYPVFLGTQGALNIVLVGPYDTDAEARSVAQRISQSNLGVPDPTVYLLEADDESTAAASSTPAATPPASQAVVATTPAATPATTPAASQPAGAQSAAQPTGGDRYLQAGAYGSRDSSLPQRERLEGLGFVVSERIESDLIKLLIGPFDASGLANAQSRLQAAGIESFPR
ncbi:MAG TPA: SPOR domain-containing protein [Trueperaceae bacterium]|nr:SPOR domain-containing protein [Trueperaceae bacterium]